MSDQAREKHRLVEPTTLKGFQDLLPDEMIARNRVVDTIRRVYEGFGFAPLDTPILEYLMTLVGTGGEETNKQLFRLESPEREPIAMRFDLTVPFARLIAQYPQELQLPLRRYHIGPVFRADKPGPGRFRQFTQFDIDAAGSEAVAVDAEIVAAMSQVMRELGLDNRPDEKDFRIRINNRKLVDALLEGTGIVDEEIHKWVLRVVDKLDKVGDDNVRRELGDGRIDESGDPIKGVGLPPETIETVLSFIMVKGVSRCDTIERVIEVLPDSEITQVAVQEMRDLAACLESLGVSEDDAVFDPSLARGLDYYTGPVFEGVLLGAPEFGSIMGGGRYDQLVSRFMDTSIPSTGASIGLDRFVAALRHAGKIQPAGTIVRALIVSTPGVPAAELLSIAAELRRNEICSIAYFGDGKTGLGRQLSYANSQGIPVAVIVGEDELARGVVSIKDLQAGKKKREGIEDREQYRKAGKTGQVTVPRAEAVQCVKELLDAGE